MQGVRVIIGLGNWGPEYQKTRHNIGHLYVDQLSQEFQSSWVQHPTGVSYTKIAVSGTTLYLVKTKTYMNISGLPLKKFCDYYKLAAEQIAVAHDEIDLPCGILKLKKGGGHGGHRGMLDMAQHGMKDCWRLRFGVGRPPHQQDVSQWVLSSPPETELRLWKEMILLACQGTELLLQGRFQDIMNDWHLRR